MQRAGLVLGRHHHERRILARRASCSFSVYLPGTHLHSYSRSFSSTNNKDNNNNKHGGSGSGYLRVAVVGGGASGMSTALHLAAFAASKEGQKVIRGPVDLYEATCADVEEQEHEEEKMLLGDYSRGSGAVGRSIGVGIWSTALMPFTQTNRPSHQHLLSQLDQHGYWIQDVGYRTPTGRWLAQSSLSPFSPLRHNDNQANTSHQHQHPSLLFLQENLLLQSLRSAVQMEQEGGWIQTHYNHTVRAIVCDDLPSHNEHDIRGGRLLFANKSNNNNNTNNNKNEHQSSQYKYHLIIAAGGMHSRLRQLYSKHLEHDYQAKFYHQSWAGRGRTDFTTKLKTAPGDDDENAAFSWDGGVHASANVPPSERDFEERGYVVLRGNAPPLAQERPPMSFQTWGEGKSMRFATVPVPLYPHKNNNHNQNQNQNQPAMGQVWFATTNDPALLRATSTTNTTPEQRREVLLQAFASWHDPIPTLIQSTPPQDILCEVAVAHRHCSAAVGSGFQVQRSSEYSGGGTVGEEPVVTFVGDAEMTVDPVLAQGFTVGMEDAYQVVKCVSRALAVDPNTTTGTDSAATDTHATTTTNNMQSTNPMDKLRKELMTRHDDKEERLLCLLRATELVQALAQPQSATLGGFLAKRVIRPWMGSGVLVPEGVKKKVFDWMVRYSLGLHLKR